MDFSEQLRTEGYAIVSDVLHEDAVQQYVAKLGDDSCDGVQRGGRRNLLAVQEMRALAQSPRLMAFVQTILGEGAFPVRGILFDKQDGANWKVPWHQDVTIAVKTRIDTEGYGPWSVKEGVLHVQPPSAVLEGMMSVRLHLDDCPASNGALRVVAGSHRHGKLDQNTITNFVTNDSQITCEIKRGGALLMSPLTIHASSAAEKPQHRRVIHFDYANVNLANGLDWFERG